MFSIPWAKHNDICQSTSNLQVLEAPGSPTLPRGRIRQPPPAPPQKRSQALPPRLRSAEARLWREPWPNPVAVEPGAINCLSIPGVCPSSSESPLKVWDTPLVDKRMNLGSTLRLPLSATYRIWKKRLNLGKALGGVLGRPRTQANDDSGSTTQNT